jgi:hypothetical protein
MSHLHSPSLRFAASFVDAVTVRPFYADLKRMKEQAKRFGSLPGYELEEVEAEFEAADAA